MATTTEIMNTLNANENMFVIINDRFDILSITNDVPENAIEVDSEEFPRLYVVE